MKNKIYINTVHGKKEFINIGNEYFFLTKYCSHKIDKSSDVIPQIEMEMNKLKISKLI